MAEVSFEWADGGSAAGAMFYTMRVFSPDGEKIEPRTVTREYHKQGGYSHSDLTSYVPVGSLILMMGKNSHHRFSYTLWKAVKGRPEIWSQSSSWASCPTWPDVPESLSEETWHKILRQIVKADVVAQWEQNGEIEDI